MFKKKESKIILSLILVSYFMTLLDNSIIFTGTTKIAQSLSLNQTELAWVQTAYAISYGGLLLVGGRLGDLYGRKKVFLISVLLFGLGSLFVGTSRSGMAIISARAFQGIGAAILAPTTLALLMDSFHGKERTAAISGYGSVAGIGASIGLLVGGMFASFTSWRDGFFMNVPIAVAIFILGMIYLPSSTKDEKNKGGLDWGGAVFSVIAMFTLVYALNGANSPVTFITCSLLSLLIFILFERKSKLPLVPLSLFKNRERISGYGTRFLYMGAMLGFWFVTPQIMQTQLGWTPLEAGMGFLPLTIVNFIVALQVPRLINKFGNTNVLRVGILITAMGMALFTLFDAKVGYVFGIGMPMVILGIGQGLAFSPMTNAGIAQANQSESGAASGVVNVMHQLGGSVGLSLMVLIGNNFSLPMVRFHSEICVAVVMLIVAFVLSIVLLREKK